MALPQENRYTLADALAWDEQDRVELIDGFSSCNPAPALPGISPGAAGWPRLSGYTRKSVENCLGSSVII